jgi:hypothetical protein
VRSRFWKPLSGDDYRYPAAWFVPLDVPKAVQKSLLKAS